MLLTSLTKINHIFPFSLKWLMKTFASSLHLLKLQLSKQGHFMWIGKTPKKCKKNSQKLFQMNSMNHKNKKNEW